MKSKNYIIDTEKHDITKIKRCLYTEDNVAEINNPIPAVSTVPMAGELTLDEQVQRIMRRTILAKQAQIEKNSVEDISEAWDFDIDGPEDKTPFEFASEALDIQNLDTDDEIEYEEVDEVPENTPPEQVVEPSEDELGGEE